MGTFRLWLAVIVVLSHAPLGILNRPLWNALAVSAFYVLSGFLIQLIISERFPGTWNFYKSRFLRIFPLYYLVLIASWLWADHPVFDSAIRSGNPATVTFALFENLCIFGQEIGRFLYLDTATGALAWSKPAQSEFASSIPLIGQSWTLALELGFYLIAPFLLRQRTIVLVAVVAACQIPRILFPPASFGDWSTSWFNGVPPVEIGTFVAGSLAFRLYDRFLRNRVLPRGLGAAVLVGLLVYGWNPDYREVWYYASFLVLTALATPVLFAATRHNRFDRFLGDLSYAVYLIHVIFVDQVNRYGVPAEWAGPVVLVASIVVSVPLVRLLEKPIDRYRARFA
jgi:peptidoglycan/LPS O-acetylase OafA/YrhL